MKNSCFIKICGVTRLEDVELIGGSGADYIGLLVNMPSPRTLDPEKASVFASRSKIPVIILFFNPEEGLVVECAERIRPAGVQLQGDETPEFVASLRARLDCEIWKAVHIPADAGADLDAGAYKERIAAYAESGVNKALLDTIVRKGDTRLMGGTGVTYDWNAARVIAAESPLPVIMAGGLTPENVAEAIRTVRPAGVDLASGVESSKGIKDPAKVTAFVKNVRSAEI